MHRAVKAADLVHFFNEDGLGAIVNSSRGIIAAYKQEKYAKFGEEHYAEASRQAVKDMVQDISTALEKTDRRKQMSKKIKEICTVISQECIGTDIYSMWLQTEDDCSGTQYQDSLYPVLYTDRSKLLPRPISLCEIDRGKGQRYDLFTELQDKVLVQKSFPDLQPGDSWIPVLGPLGNGFPLGGSRREKSICLWAAASVIPPMLETAKAAAGKKMAAVLGYRDRAVS